MSTPPPINASLPPRRHGTIILIVVFLLGLIAGGSGGVWLAPKIRHHFDRRPPLAERMRKLLDLNAQQTQQFTAIAQEAMHRWQQLHQPYQPQFEKLRDQERALHQQEWQQFAPIREEEDNKIRAILTPAQRARFDSWLEQFRREHPPGGLPRRPHNH